MHEYFEKQCAICPEKTAIIEAGQAVSYNELNKTGNKLAATLSHFLQGNQFVVATMIPAGIRLVSSLLAIFKSGNIYLPLDLGFPKARLKEIFTHTKPAVLVTTSEMGNLVKQLLQEMEIKVSFLILISETSDAWVYNELDEACILPENVAQHIANPTCEVDPDAGSYIIYTSGSTGMGKAILGCHKGLSHFIHWEMNEFDVYEDCRVSQLSRITFDASFRDIFLPLCTGGTLCIPDVDVRTNILKLVEWIEASNITMIHCVPSLFRLILKELAHTGESVGRMSSVRHILMAGESLYAREINEWRKLIGTHIELVNLYGTSETTLAKTFHRIQDVPADGSQLIHAGKAISNTVIAIINPGHICRVGEIGEIYIKTPFCTKGYYNDEEMTTQVFVQNPLVADGVDIVYKTGDMGRYLPDRSIEVLGRIDDQVKINGIRVELAEVSQAISKIKGIEQVVVMAHKNAGYENELVCYYTGDVTGADTLREQLRKELNEEIIPGYFIKLEEFPLNLNGKIDKRSLPKPEELLIEWGEYEPVQNETEATLERIWQEVLGRQRIGRKAAFFKIGGTSLKAIQVISRIYRELDVSLTIKSFLSCDTIEKLSVMIHGAVRNVFVEIPVVQKQLHYPLSAAQRRLWIQGQLENQENVYNMSFGIDLTGPFHLAALERAFSTIIERHESLRTQFIMVAGEPRQQIYTTDQVNFKISVHDMRNELQREMLVSELASREASQPFRLDTLPLLRCNVIQMEEGRTIVLINIHHIIADGWSVQVLFNELEQCYEGYKEGRQVSLPPLRIQFKDYSSWLANQLSADRLVTHRQFWMSQFKGDIPLLELPLDFYRPQVQTFRGHKLYKTLTGTSAGKISAFVVDHNITAFTYLMACVNVLLYKYSNQSDFVIGTAVNGRLHPDLENQIGLLVNLLPIRCSFDPACSFKDLAELVRETTFNCYDHEVYPFDMLVEDLGIPKQANRWPLFDVLVQMQEQQAFDREWDKTTDTNADSFEFGINTSKFDLTFNFFYSKTMTKITIEYNMDLFKSSTIGRFMNDLGKIIDITTEDDAISIKELKKQITAVSADSYLKDSQFINEELSEDF